MKNLLKDKGIRFGVITIIIIAILAFIVPLLLNTDFAATSLSQMRGAPSFSHPFGTDNLGRDLFVRVLQGGQISLIVGILATFIAVIIGILYGAAAGFIGGKTDAVMMRVVDIIMSFPTFFLILAIMASVRNSYSSLFLVIFVIGLTSWTGLARLIRSEILSLKEREFILIEKGLGLSNIKIIVRHLLPNTLSSIIVFTTLGIAGAMLTEAALSYFGLGVQPPIPSWGNILKEGQGINIIKAPWISFFPGFFIFVTVLAFSIVGNGLQKQTVKGEEE